MYRTMGTCRRRGIVLVRLYACKFFGLQLSPNEYAYHASAVFHTPAAMSQSEPPH